jgi:hypothetical protein
MATARVNARSSHGAAAADHSSNSNINPLVHTRYHPRSYQRLAICSEPMLMRSGYIWM